MIVKTVDHAPASKASKRFPLRACHTTCFYRNCIGLDWIEVSLYGAGTRQVYMRTHASVNAAMRSNGSALASLHILFACMDAPAVWTYLVQMVLQLGIFSIHAGRRGRARCGRRAGSTSSKTISMCRTGWTKSNRYMTPTKRARTAPAS